MKARALRGPTGVWVLLMLATLAGFGTAQAAGVGFALAVLAAVFKAHLIARHYMDLQSAPIAWRLVFAGLIGLSGAIIGGLHFLA